MDDKPWPYNSVWVEREEPLPQCPMARCRRAGSCARMAVPWKNRLPCRQTHEHRDELYERVAAKIDKFTAELKRNRKPGDPDPTVPEGSPEFERRFAFLYNLFRERAEQYEAEQRAAAKQKKPARRLASTESA